MSRLLCDYCEREVPVYNDEHVSITINEMMRELVVCIEILIDDTVNDEPFYYSNIEKVSIIHCSKCGREL